MLGLDDLRREVLTFIEGYVPPDLGTWSDEQLVRAAELFRRFHEATTGPAITGEEEEEEEEVVCHNDLSPCNTVFVKGMPSAFIDFDEAAPGSRRPESTIAYARDSVRWIRAEMAWLDAH